MSAHAPKNPPRPSDGECFLTLYGRYRDVVREELEAAGLDAEAAERLVGTVFERLAALVQGETAPDPVVASIRTLAREVSAAPGTSRHTPGLAPLLGDPRICGG